MGTLSPNPRRRCLPPPPPPGSARSKKSGATAAGDDVGGRVRSPRFLYIAAAKGRQAGTQADRQAGSSALCPVWAGRVTLAWLGWGHAAMREREKVGRGVVQEAVLSVIVGFWVGRTDKMLREGTCGGRGFGPVLVWDSGTGRRGANGRGSRNDGIVSDREPAEWRRLRRGRGSAFLAATGHRSFWVDNWTRVICGEAQVPFPETAAPLARRAEDLTPPQETMCCCSGL